MSTTKISVFLDPELHRKLSYHKIETGVSIQSLVENAIRLMLYPASSDPEIEHCLGGLRRSLLKLKETNPRDARFVVNVLTSIAEQRSEGE